MVDQIATQQWHSSKKRLDFLINVKS